MSNVQIVYWSGTGNTEAMAEAVAEGVKAAGAEASLVNVDGANVEELAQSSGFALGCPSMGAEELEEGSMEPFVSELEGKVSGKQIVLFGSYGWGDGEWMRNWEERMTAAGATVVGGEGIITQDAPDGEVVEKLSEAGKALAAI